MITSLFFHTVFVPVPVTEETVMYHCFNEIKDLSEDLYNKRRKVKIEGMWWGVPLYEDRYKFEQRKRHYFWRLRKKYNLPGPPRRKPRYEEIKLDDGSILYIESRE